MAEQFENACRLSELIKATGECARNVRWKESVEAYEDKTILKNHILSKEIQKETYKISPYIQFYVMEPKERLIHATRIRDRVWQRSMCNNGIYDDMTRGLIYDNAACQKEKGVDFTINRLKTHLYRYFSENKTNKGWAAHLDIRHYFPSTPHETAKDTIRKRVTDAEFVRQVETIIDSFTDMRPENEIAADPFGKRGIHLGCQMSQLIQLANLDQIDHYQKEHMHAKHYIRYMDDFILIDNSKEHLLECVEQVKKSAEALGLSLNEKSCVYPLEQGIVFLRLHFYLTESGKVIIRLDHHAIAKERKKLRQLKKLADEERITMEDVRIHYNSWTSHVKRANSYGVRKQMNNYYAELFGEKPNVKL